MCRCLRRLAALDQQKGEAVVRTRQLGIELERAAVGADRLVHPAGAGEGDRHVLEDLGIVRMIPHRQAVRRQRRVEVALTLQRQRLFQIIEALRLRAVVRLAAAEQAAEPGHSWTQREGWVARTDARPRHYCTRAQT